MPDLDLSDAVLAVEFQDTFAVVRRPETITNKGRSLVAEQWFRRVYGVVTMASPNDLERLGDYQIQGRAISVVTTFKLYSESETVTMGRVQGYQPDLLLWDGTFWIVKVLDNYSRWGQGFVEAICEEITFVGNPAQPHGMKPQLDFSVALNSGQICFLVQQGQGESMLITVMDADSNPQTIIVPAQGATDDHSGSIDVTNTTQVMADADENRSGLYFQNRSGRNMFVNDDGSAMADNAFVVVPNAIWPPPNYTVPTNAISVAGTATDKFVFRTW